MAQLIKELPWIEKARSLIGEKEYPGSKHNPKIVNFWKLIKRGGIKDDETAWCAGFTGAMFELVGITSSRFEGANSYLKWGTPVLTPCYGCVVVFSRPGGYHVGFVVGKNAAGHLLVLGGNQKNMICISPFKMERVAGYRMPAGDWIRQPLPTLEVNGTLSTNEA